MKSIKDKISKVDELLVRKYMLIFLSQCTHIALILVSLSEIVKFVSLTVWLIATSHDASSFRLKDVLLLYRNGIRLKCIFIFICKYI